MTRFFFVFLTITLFSSSVFAQQARGNQSVRGAANIGLNTVFNFSSSTNEIDGADDVSNSNLFLRLEPQFEYFVADGVPVGLSLGWLRRQLSRGENETSASNDVLVFLTTGYHLSTTQKFAIVGTVGVGGYAGSSSTDTEFTDVMGNTNTLNETTSTLGFGATAGLGASYQVGKNAQFRAGVTYTGLFGTETIESSDLSLGVTTNNVALNAGIYYVF